MHQGHSHGAVADGMQEVADPDSKEKIAKEDDPEGKFYSFPIANTV